MANNFRENLRNELNYQGITVKELSARTNIPIPTLDCYLGTRATVPSVDAAVKIAQVLGVSVEYLVTGEEDALGKPLLGSEIRGLLQNYKFLCEDDRKMVIAIVQLFKNKRNKNNRTGD